MKNKKTVMVTGGTGYIGSHAVLACLDAGHKVIVIDKDKGACDHLTKCLKRRKKLQVFNADIDNDVYIDGIFSNEKVDAVIHCAAYICVPESVENPLKYYENNTAKSIKLLNKMKNHGVNTFVFASTAAVYGAAKDGVALTETTPCKPINAYGESKLMIETVLKKHAKQNPNFRYASFRFFNVAGNDLGNRVQDIHWREKQNLVPKIMNIVIRQKGTLKVFGTDLPTADGSCVRDYIHPSDLATAMLTAVEKDVHGVFNLGTKNGSSVWEMVKESVSVTQTELDVEHAKPRAGDPHVLIADSTKFREATGWEPTYTTREMIETAYKAYRKVSK